MRLEVYQCDEVKYSYSINGTYSSNASDYKILEQELINSANKAGYSITPPYNFQRHHIVPLSEHEAQYSRDILEALDININSAVNGLLLPSGFGDITYIVSENLHNGGHSRSYCAKIEKELSDVLVAYFGDSQDYLKEISNIDVEKKEELTKLICDCLTKIKTKILNGDKEFKVNNKE